MTEHAIIFTAESGRAILAGKKTQTRRVVKFDPDWTADGTPCFDSAGWPLREDIYGEFVKVRCPFGVPGDRLWIKEAIHDVGDAIGYEDGTVLPMSNWPWKRKKLSPLFMPYGASRLTLEVTEVRVQRLKEISLNDINAEGISESGTQFIDEHNARGHWANLWDSINAKRGFGWDKNPFVWALTFKKVEAKP